MDKLLALLIGLSLSITGATAAETAAPWGNATEQQRTYKPQKVVYDVAVSSLREMTGVLDRASYLYSLTGSDPFDSSIVLVLHGGEIPFFAIENYARYKALVDRAQSLVTGEVLKIRMCKLAAEGQGYAPKDIHGFIEMVPMGDAEIVRLQNEEGHAYMR